MSEWRRELEKLRAQSAKVLDIEFEQGPTEVIDLVIGKKRSQDGESYENGIVLNATPSDTAIAAICARNVRLAEILPKNHDLKRNKSDNIHRELRIVKYVNKICQDPVLEKEIKELENLLEEKRANLEYLYMKFRKSEKIKKMRQEELEQMEIDEDETDESADDIAEIRKEELDMKRIEALIKQKKQERQDIARRKQEQSNIQKELRGLASKQSTKQSSVARRASFKDAEQIEKQVKFKKQHTTELDSLLTVKKVEKTGSKSTPSTTTTTTTATTTEDTYTRSIGNLRQLLSSSVDDVEQTTEAPVLLRAYETLDKNLVDDQSKLERAKKVGDQVKLNKPNQQKLLISINKLLETNGEDEERSEAYNKLFPHYTQTTVLESTNERQIMAPLLLKLYNEGEMTLASLTAYIEELAREQGLDKKEAVRCIYKSVSLNFVVIDRSHKDSLVRLK